MRVILTIFLSGLVLVGFGQEYDLKVAEPLHGEKKRAFLRYKGAIQDNLYILESNLESIRFTTVTQYTSIRCLSRKNLKLIKNIAVRDILKDDKKVVFDVEIFADKIVLLTRHKSEKGYRLWWIDPVSFRPIRKTEILCGFNADKNAEGKYSLNNDMMVSANGQFLMINTYNNVSGVDTHHEVVVLKKGGDVVYHKKRGVDTGFDFDFWRARYLITNEGRLCVYYDQRLSKDRKDGTKALMILDQHGNITYNKPLPKDFLEAFKGFSSCELNNETLYFHKFEKRDVGGVTVGYIDLESPDEFSLNETHLSAEIHADLKSVDKREKYLEKAKKGKNYISSNWSAVGHNISFCENGDALMTVNFYVARAVGESSLSVLCARRTMILRVSRTGKILKYKILHHHGKNCVFLNDFGAKAVENGKDLVLFTHTYASQIDGFGLQIRRQEDSRISMVTIKEDQSWYHTSISIPSEIDYWDVSSVGVFKLSESQFVIPFEYKHEGKSTFLLSSYFLLNI